MITAAAMTSTAAASSETSTVTRTVVTAGVALGLFVAVWAFFMGLTGWYRDPALAAVFFLVIPVHLVVIILALRRTRHAGLGWARQTFAGTALSLVATPIVFAQSLLFSSIFPAVPGSPSAVVAALTGAVATAITGLVFSALVAIFIRSRA